ncbi:MAG: hypothetical protein ACRD1V_18345, partial [Vicinamibacterales bacterium]
MPIRPSAAGEIRRLIDALGEPDAIRREAAIARLAVIGPRAVDHLLQEYNGAAPAAQAAMLRALELIADPRALPVARTALDAAQTEVAIAAAGALRALMAANTPQPARDALDALVARALDWRQPAPI